MESNRELLKAIQDWEQAISTFDLADEARRVALDTLQGLVHEAYNRKVLTPKGEEYFLADPVWIASLRK